MDFKRCKQKQQFFSQKLLFYLASICFFSFFALICTTGNKSPCSDFIRSQSDRAEVPYPQEFESTIVTNEGQRKWGLFFISLRRRYLRGIGSSPPSCTAKCDKCTPCKPVRVTVPPGTRVTVPPGTRVTTEYYPEAWRCKCGDKLYMP